MKTFLIFLLFSLTFSEKPTQSTEEVDVVNKFFKHFKVIQEPSHPVFYKGLAFYWYGEYIPSPERPQTCIILSSHPEWPFDGSVFRNGTIPTAALFGCYQGWLCRDTRCVKPLSHFNVVTYTLTGIIFLLLLCLLVGIPKAKREVIERPRRPSPRGSIMDNVFLPNDTQIQYTEPPRYTQ